MKKTYTIPNMHCSACVMRLEALEDNLPGVRRIQASYQRQRFEVEFDESLISEQEILQAIRDLDYEVIT